MKTTCSVWSSAVKFVHPYYLQALQTCTYTHSSVISILPKQPYSRHGRSSCPAGYASIFNLYAPNSHT